MSKAMLIMDMPNNCIDCMLSYDSASCQITGERFWKDGFEPNNQILHNCPLRPAPTLKEDNSIIHLERYEGYLEGWNDCVREMLGGAE